MSQPSQHETGEQHAAILHHCVLFEITHWSKKKIHKRISKNVDNCHAPVIANNMSYAC